MALSENERKVLQELVKDSSTPNIHIAKKLELTPAAIGKIRRKLENQGIIYGYTARLDFEKIGLHAFGVILAKLTVEGWNYKGGIGIQEEIAANPNIISIYRVPEGSITHILVCAFRNIQELDKYLHVLQSQFSPYMEIVKTYTLSNRSIIKDAWGEVLDRILEEWDAPRMPEPVLFGKMIGDSK